MSLGLIPTRRRTSAQHQTPDDRLAARQRLLDRQAAELSEREAALADRERRLKKQIRAAQDRDDESSARTEDVTHSHDYSLPQQQPGATAPGRVVNATVELLIRADAMRRAELPCPGPKTTLSPAAKLIIEQAELLQTESKAATEPDVDPAIAAILAGDRRLKRQGGSD